MKTEKRIIGSREFVGGAQRAIYEDEDGRQFVIDDEGQAVYGIWLLPDDAVTVEGDSGLFAQTHHRSAGRPECRRSGQDRGKTLFLFQ